jgi:transposase
VARYKKRGLKEDRTIVFVDESGFYLLPGVVKTYSPRGERPRLNVFETYDHLSVIGGITPAGDIYTMIQEEAINSIKCIAFLRHLQHFISRRLIVIWDRGPIHRSNEMKSFLSGGAAKKIHLERLPGYAPDLNPAEGIWAHLKQVDLRNVCCDDLPGLHRILTSAIIRLKIRPHLIQSFFLQAELDIDEWE